MTSKASEWLTEDALQMITGWARDGLTEEQIAKNKMGIAYSTFRRWKEQYEAISAALKKGRAPLAEKIEESLYERCLWRQVEELTMETQKDESGKTVATHTKKTVRWVAPSDACIIFALKNLKKEKWKDKPQSDSEADQYIAKVADMLSGIKSAIN